MIFALQHRSLVLLVLEFQIPLGKTFHCGSQARTVRKCCPLGGWHVTQAQANWINTLGLSFDSRAEGSKEQVLRKNPCFLEILSSSGSWLSWASISVFFVFPPFPWNQWIISYPSNKPSFFLFVSPQEPEVLVSTICYQKSPGCYRFYKLSEGVWTWSWKQGGQFLAFEAWVRQDGIHVWERACRRQKHAGQSLLSLYSEDRGQKGGEYFHSSWLKCWQVETTYPVNLLRWNISPPNNGGKLLHTVIETYFLFTSHHWVHLHNVKG